MIKPPFDLDSDFREELDAYRDQCFEVADRCVAKAKEYGVPNEALYSYMTDRDNNMIWDPLPELRGDDIEFSGRVWRHQDTDYVSVLVNRHVVEGRISVDDWAKARRAIYQAHLEQARAAAEERAAAAEAAAKEKRRQQFEELKKEFDGERATNG